ncbi:phosphoglycerate mutase, 2,3-bisphosphoglycerate-independent [Geobacter metallireducens RCH3]|uniref:2,3-bisphosphoglycerate-independent phosphoglycerate mutase n=1 Tax=Geobacter metallireducens (strain ATCC 53774 / DSM 7210 / GS-15) TaxID=269799 RepID=Q39QQ8_GEOMG|nr:2,3-bisphosphoglycerate-independent phosphoglycerate mutase [Geobacter metallireducens]ABB33416.1 phosphoglycerate mutase, 2,3-bisphosphoglycerate-independent [Geobacter metallireducens GS-15]EHP87468.1 phosphoglycerate mutase, 2,3-bisphosphoglycerate-independent [Geobacter metallireducens RCH3]
MTRPLMLMILDGWGINPSAEHNAVAQARTPNLDTLLATYPTTEIQTSGMAVGLPDGQMGNSEVGHLNIGAGRVVYQDLTRITKAIQDGDFFTNPVLLECIAKTKAAGGRLHLAGLLSDGGVHSHNTHLYALLELARRQGLTDVFIHAILDGRDTPPKSGADYLAQLEAEIARIGVGAIATVMGRYWAMDRDNRWERVERAYNAMVQGEGVQRASSAEAIEASYAADVTDEFVEPSVMVRDGAPVGQLRDGDGFIFLNFRSDRAREITRALALPDCEGFARQARPNLASYVCMTEYDATFGLPIAFGPEELKNILGDVLAHAGIRQLRIAETEKYAHVTFFFNGGVEEPFPLEERCLIPSPKDVATYDQKPEMSAYPVTDELLKRIDSDAYDVVIVNFANADMVGHTGILEAAARAVEAVDSCVGRIVAKVREKGGAVIITADHGNAEKMVDETGGPHTAHTSEPVHLVLVDDSRKGIRLRAGTLADIAPTMLEILGLSQPAEITGKSLIAQS